MQEGRRGETLSCSVSWEVQLAAQAALVLSKGKRQTLTCSILSIPFPLVAQVLCELPMPLFVGIVLAGLTDLCVLGCTEEVKDSMSSTEPVHTSETTPREVCLCIEAARGQKTSREVCPFSVRRWQSAAVVGVWLPKGYWGPGKWVCWVDQGVPRLTVIQWVWSMRELREPLWTFRVCDSEVVGFSSCPHS